MTRIVRKCRKLCFPRRDRFVISRSSVRPRLPAHALPEPIRWRCDPLKNPFKNRLLAKVLPLFRRTPHWNMNFGATGGTAPFAASRWAFGTPPASILVRLTTRPAMTLAGIVINCSRDERSGNQWSIIGRRKQSICPEGRRGAPHCQ